MSDLDVLEQCSHLPASFHAQPDVVAKYRTVVAWDVHRQQFSKSPLSRRKMSTPQCGTCSTFLARPFVCLHCSYNGCWLAGHAQAHIEQTDHVFCADAKSGAIYCSLCRDFIHDANLDAIYLDSILTAEEKQTRFQTSKTLRHPFTRWLPSADDEAALDNADSVPCQGRRGLLNLGQTCFLNVVLQSFLHNPLIRNYFLADKHNLKHCTQEDCISCEMDKLFSQIYSGEPGPHGPITFLSTWWKKSAELAGYAQQDAHEFFMSTLNHIHSSSRGSTNVSCNCIIHCTFAGQLQSDVQCQRCATVTNTIDPMLDISLELRGKPGEDTLASCLRRYTQPEKLGSKEYSCARCGKGSHEATKRLSILKLPPVLSFQFKRFEQKTDKATASKVDGMVRFPATLNMAPYTTLSMNQADKQAMCGPDALYEYELFAVINHEGQINNGHYTNFARFQDEWYRFDDDKVSHSNLSTCLNSVAYMCFYVKKHLDYKPNTTPSYVLAREIEASREKELASRPKEPTPVSSKEDLDQELDEALMAIM